MSKYNKRRIKSRKAKPLKKRFISFRNLVSLVPIQYHNLLVNRYFLTVFVILGLAFTFVSLDISLLVVEILCALAWITVCIGLLNNKSLKTEIGIIISIVFLTIAVLTDIYVIRPLYYTTYYITPSNKSLTYDLYPQGISGDIAVYIGKSVIVYNVWLKEYRVITYDYEDILSFKLSSEGILISGILIDPDGNTICSIQDNNFIFNNNKDFYLDRPNSHELYIYNRTGRKFLGVHFKNKYEIVITGIFSLKNKPTIEIDEDKVRVVGKEISFTGGRFENTGILIECDRDPETTRGFPFVISACD